MGEFEAVGDIVTGGMIGRAVEPSAGEPGTDGHTHEKNCLNCGTPLQGDFCHACGQHAHIHRTLRAFFHDFLHGVLHFEGKIWNTLPLLTWQPGELTRRYIDGERARFVSPIALFLFCVFLLFATVSLTGDLNGPAGDALHANLTSDVSEAQERVADLATSRAERREEGKPTANIDGKIAGAKAKLAALQNRQKSGAGPVVVSDDMPGWLRPILGKATDNPELLAYKLKTNAYKFSWALIPISMPFLWLLFPFSRRFRFYDHIIFVTYSLTFMTLLFISYLLLSSAGLSSIAGLASFIAPVHMYRQLRGAYGLSRKSAIWRTLLLVLFAFMAISLFVSLLVGIGVFD